MIQIPSSKHVYARKSRVMQIPPGQQDTDRAYLVDEGSICPEKTRSSNKDMICPSGVWNAVLGQRLDCCGLRHDYVQYLHSGK